MKKTQVLFAAFAMFLFGCAIPLASVRARQELAQAGPNGCSYTHESGVKSNGSTDYDKGNYVYANGFAHDPGRFYEQVSDGNAQGIYACADLDMVHDYGSMYKTYAQTMLVSSQGDDGLKKDLENTKAAVKELSDNVVDLATIATPQGAASKGKLTVVGKLEKAAPAATTAPAAPTANDQRPTANPAPVDPMIAGRIRATHNNAELISVLRAAAQADPADAAMFNGLANTVAKGTESNFEQNRRTLVDAFAREGESR